MRGLPYGDWTMSALKYSLRPKEVHALEWTGDNWDEMNVFTEGKFFRCKRDIWIKRDNIRDVTPLDRAWVGDYVIKDAEGALTCMDGKEFHQVWQVA